MRATGLIRIAIVLLSLLAGGAIYRALEFDHPVLVMDVKTFEQGVRRINITGHDGRTHTRSFVLNGRWGLSSSEPGKKLYVVELPATRIREIGIEPLGQPGLFEINRITLADDAASYTWDERGDCSLKRWQPEIAAAVSCPDGSPGITATDGGAVIIRSVADIGRHKNRLTRTAWAAGTALFVLIGSWLLAGALSRSEGRGRWRQTGVVSAWLILAAVYCWHLYLVCTYAMDAPYYDEWDYFDTTGKLCIPDRLSLAWLFDFWSEHIIVPTKLQIWLNLKLFHLNLIYDKVGVYLLYGLLLAAVALLKKRLTGSGRFIAFPLFMLFLLSPVAHENHLWGFQSQTHFFLILSIVPLFFAYRNPLTSRDAALFCLPLLANIFTFGAGVVVAVVYLCGHILYILGGMRDKSVGRLRGWGTIAAWLAVLLPCCYFRFHGYVKAGWTPEPLSPLTLEYWEYFSNIISFGAGVISMNALPGVIWAIIVLLPVLRLVNNHETRRDPATWIVATAILGIFAVLGIISHGRGGFHEPKTSRYAEYGLMLIPLASVAWWRALGSARGRGIMLSLLWCGLFISLFDTWTAQPYREKKQMDLFHLECAERFFEGTGDGVCQGSRRGLERAAQLGASFTRQFTQKSGNGR